MIFDPFGDFETRGYLRNFDAEKNPESIKTLEHIAFLDNLETAHANLASRERLGYEDVLQTHKILFEFVYPWAGQDREATVPGVGVSKGSVLFAHPKDARRAVEHALEIGQDRAFMAEKPGEIMGFLAYGHPFLDGNGRTIMIVHAELTRRANFSIDWAATDKVQYLTSLTRELSQPGKGHLDDYLRPFLRDHVGAEPFAHLTQMLGLAGSSDSETNEVVGSVENPVLKARYELQEQLWRPAYGAGDRPVDPPLDSLQEDINQR